MLGQRKLLYYRIDADDIGLEKGTYRVFWQKGGIHKTNIKIPGIFDENKSFNLYDIHIGTNIDIPIGYGLAIKIFIVDVLHYYQVYSYNMVYSVRETVKGPVFDIPISNRKPITNLDKYVDFTLHLYDPNKIVNKHSLLPIYVVVEGSVDDENRNGGME